MKLFLHFWHPGIVSQTLLSLGSFFVYFECPIEPQLLEDVANVVDIEVSPSLLEGMSFDFAVSESSGP